MITSLNLEPILRIVLLFTLTLGLSSRLAIAQEAAVAPEPEAAEEYAPSPAIGSPASDFDFQMYRLSYMQGDRVIALLKHWVLRRWNSPPLRVSRSGRRFTRC